MLLVIKSAQLHCRRGLPHLTLDCRKVATLCARTLASPSDIRPRLLAATDFASRRFDRLFLVGLPCVRPGLHGWLAQNSLQEWF